MNIWTEFEEPTSILCQVIIWTRFGRYIIKLKVTVTLTFDRLISKSRGIIYIPPETNACAKFDEPMSILCLVNMQTWTGLYICRRPNWNLGRSGICLGRSGICLDQIRILTWSRPNWNSHLVQADLESV